MMEEQTIMEEKPYRSRLIGWEFTAEEMAKMKRSIEDSNALMEKLCAPVSSPRYKSPQQIADEEEAFRRSQKYALTSEDAGALLGITPVLLGSLYRDRLITRVVIKGKCFYDYAELMDYKASGGRLEAKRTYIEKRDEGV